MNAPDPETANRLTRLLANNRVERDGWTSAQGRDLLLATHGKLAAVARERFGGELRGRLIARCGMDSAGGAFALVSGWQGAAFLGIDEDQERIKRHIRTGFCDYLVTDLGEALRILRSAVHARKPVSVGLAADPLGALAELARLGVVPDLLIDSPASNTGGLVKLQRLGSAVLHE